MSFLRRLISGGGNQKRNSEDKTRFFFGSDFHASEATWRKFTNSAKFYQPSTLIAGGDVAGKQLTPLVAQGNNRWTAQQFGQDLEVHGEEELLQLEKSLRNAGFYTIRTDPDELRTFTPAEVERRFEQEMARVLRSWCELAAERLQPLGVSLTMMAGNDDPGLTDQIIEDAPWVTCAEGKVVELPGGFQMLTLGISNQTPWQCPRDCTEDDIARRIDTLAAQVASWDKAILNIHVPPYDSELDVCPELDADLTPRLQGGELKLAPVGSTAVRQAIEKYQPLISLHGHIHESRGVTHIGRTTCINPGSDYQLGALKGCIIDIDSHGRVSTVLTQG